MSEMVINSGGSRERRMAAELAAKDDEIARLHCRVAELEADIPLKWQARQDEMQATIDAKGAEIARLLGELKEIPEAMRVKCEAVARDYYARYGYGAECALDVADALAALDSPAPVAGD